MASAKRMQRVLYTHTIEFQTMTFTFFFNQVEVPISFWYKHDSNPKYLPFKKKKKKKPQISYSKIRDITNNVILNTDHASFVVSIPCGTSCEYSNKFECKIKAFYFPSFVVKH